MSEQFFSLDENAVKKIIKKLNLKPGESKKINDKQEKELEFALEVLKQQQIKQYEIFQKNNLFDTKERYEDNEKKDVLMGGKTKDKPSTEITIESITKKLKNEVDSKLKGEGASKMKDLTGKEKEFLNNNKTNPVIEEAERRFQKMKSCEKFLEEIRKQFQDDREYFKKHGKFPPQEDKGGGRGSAGAAPPPDDIDIWLKKEMDKELQNHYDKLDQISKEKGYQWSFKGETKEGIFSVKISDAKKDSNAEVKNLMSVVSLAEKTIQDTKPQKKTLTSQKGVVNNENHLVG